MTYDSVERRRRCRDAASGAVLALVPALLLGACGTSAPTSGAQTAYTEPGWMAEVRAADEEFRVAAEACLHEQGQVPDVQAGGYGVVVPQDEQGESLPGADAAAAAAVEACRAVVPEPEYQRDPDLQVEYERLLDQRECLVHEGYDVPPPWQSAEAWADAYARDAEAWSPWEIFDPGPDGTTTTGPDELSRVVQACPTSAAFKMIVSRAPQASP